MDNQTAYTFPLAGTRPRGKDEKEDQELEADLLSDEKELAEHNMLVDLGRNDLGRFCRFGTVFRSKNFPTSCPSTVRGEDKTALDALHQCFRREPFRGLRACQDHQRPGKQQARHLRRCDRLSGFCKYGYVYREGWHFGGKVFWKPICFPMKRS